VLLQEEEPLPDKAVYFLAVPGYADWEPAHALAELRRHGGYRVEVVALTVGPVVSMGGLTVRPTRRLEDVSAGNVAVFVLPGGDRWEHEPVEPALLELLHRLDSAGTPLAAICAATTAIARAGLLRGRRHTSNGLEYLRAQVPEYVESGQYIDQPAVRDRGLITASGLADVEFAAEIMAELGVLSETDRARWTRMFRSGKFDPDAA
jgi:putative intracellular protease/amidase